MERWATEAGNNLRSGLATYKVQYSKEGWIVDKSPKGKRQWFVHAHQQPTVDIRSVASVGLRTFDQAHGLSGLCTIGFAYLLFAMLVFAFLLYQQGTNHITKGYAGLRSEC